MKPLLAALIASLTAVALADSGEVDLTEAMMVNDTVTEYRLKAATVHFTPPQGPVTPPGVPIPYPNIAKTRR